MQVYGIDLSKEKFDVNFPDSNGHQRNSTVKNTLKGISGFLTDLPSDTVLCVEHTGTYGDLLVYLCNAYDIPIALVPGYTVKHSLGLMKGKSDPIDASRIREYGERFYDRLSFKRYQSEPMSELKQLYSLRTQLVRARKALGSGEHARSQMPTQSIICNSVFRATLRNIDGQIEHTERQIKQIIMDNGDLNRNYELMVSITGIGPVIATNLIIKTGNLERIDSARKAASYAGVCPFPNSSGNMAGKSKTSPFSDKELKSLLYMGAKTIVKHNKEYRLYYQKKQQEGKPYFLIMNNVMNKLLRTVYSVVRNRTVYSKDYICLDPRERNMNSFEKIVV